jgi:CRISPR-associated protein Cas10/Csm1 subtype III-A
MNIDMGENYDCENYDYENLMLAAVVHDIGKFWQGTEEKGKHQELGAKFLREHIPEQWQGAAVLVSEHHDDGKNISDFNSYFNSLYHILHKYTWCLPTAVYENVPDISLFDHLKSTCAIASCLSEVSDETFLGDVLKALFDKEATTDEKNTLNDEKFILIEGDLSGIQKFIYSVTSKGAAKGLRERSFYLQLLTEAISNYILRKLKILKANLLYCGGGHFYILAASSAVSNLEDIRKKSIEILLNPNSAKNWGMFKYNLILTH